MLELWLSAVADQFETALRLTPNHLHFLFLNFWSMHSLNAFTVVVLYTHCPIRTRSFVSSLIMCLLRRPVILQAAVLLAGANDISILADGVSISGLCPSHPLRLGSMVPATALDDERPLAFLDTR